MESHHHHLVLIVDDEPLVRFFACEALEGAGFHVIEAASADHALKLLRSRNDVGVLFTDVNMPGRLDGMALARLVHKGWPNISIVVTSGRPLTGRIPDDGAFLPKPYNLGEMTNVIARASGG